MQAAMNMEELLAPEGPKEQRTQMRFCSKPKRNLLGRGRSFKRRSISVCDNLKTGNKNEERDERSDTGSPPCRIPLGM